MRGMRRIGVAAALLVLSALAVPAVAAPAAIKALPEPPPAFRFRGSHGYRGFGFVGQGGDGTQALVLFVGGPGGSVIYSAPATYEESGAFHADLARLGSLDLHFVPDGGRAEARSRCGDDAFSFPTGTFQGSFRLRGEEGYTRVALETVKPSPELLFDLICSGISFGASFPGPGAELDAVRRTDGGSVELEARKKGPRGRAYVTAGIEERRGAVAISRTVGVYGGPHAFDYARRGREATVSPPAPFSGAATLRRVPGHGARLLGGLRVDFPGRSGVRLAGPGFHAHLEHVRLSGPIAHSGSARAVSSVDAGAAGPVACTATLGPPWASSSRSSALC